MNPPSLPQSWELGLIAGLHRRWSVVVAEHGVEGTSKVVGLGAVIILLR